MEALRRENDALRQRVRNNENTIANVGSTSPTASVAASFNGAFRNVIPPHTAIAPPKQRRIQNHPSMHHTTRDGISLQYAFPE